jgi:hypothetical protein
MRQTDYSRRRRVRRRFAMGGGGLAVVVAALVALAIPAAADTVNWAGPGKGGTNADGTCQNVTGSGTQQTWHFVLTSPGPGPWELTATFANSGTITDSGVQQGMGSVFFFVTTSAGDMLQSASATNGTANSQLTVSDCTLSNAPPPTTGPPVTTGPPGTTAPPTTNAVPPSPAPAAAVVAGPTLTG